MNSDGWPCLQHRGGPPGFLKVLGPHQLGFADFKGNHQLLSTGNLDGDDRVSLFLMDYPRRERLKILGHARVLDAREHTGPGDLCDQLSPSPGLRGKIERLVLHPSAFCLLPYPHRPAQGADCSTRNPGRHPQGLMDSIADFPCVRKGTTGFGFGGSCR